MSRSSRALRSLRWFGLASLLAGCAGDPGDVGEGIIGLPGDPPAPGEATFAPDEPTELWFIEFESSPLLRGGDSASLDVERRVFKRRAFDVGFRYRHRFSFDRLWNGVSVRIAQGSSAKLSEMPGVKAVYPVVPIEIDDEPTPPAPASDPELSAALAMSGADVVQSDLGLTGEDIRVGVIDSGVDYNHPDLGGCFGPGCRVAYGYDFVGDAFDSRDSSRQPVPDGDPDDCSGHGTHVAGIIGADGAVRGVAPGATLGAYRVFGCGGSTNADIMLKAMERAEADGMRVVNMSIGAPFQWPDYPTAKGADELVAKGVVVVCSIGNSGERGLWAAGAPGVGELVIGTASIDNTRLASPAFSVSPGDTTFGYNRATGSPIAPLSGSAPLLRTGTTTTTNDACAAPPAGSLAGAIALIRRGSCSFYQKSANAQTAGAVGVVLYNDRPGGLSTTVAATAPNPPITIPVVAISADDGAQLNALLDAGPVTHGWTDRVITRPNATAGRISTFSSYGPTAALTFKPDIAAPGGSIYSTVPLEMGGYDTYGGTSMASPHVAGTVALLLSARPELLAKEVRDLLQNHAMPTVWSGATGAGVPDHTYRQGAGMVRIDRAILATARITPGKLALGETEGGPFTADLKISNDGAADVTYDLSHVAAMSTASGSSWIPTNTASGAATVAFSAPSVTVPAGSTVTVPVTITASAELSEGSLFGGYLLFTPQGGAADDALRVPYAGFKGDYQTVRVLTPADQGYPWLGRRSGSSYTPLSTGGTFTLQSGDIPYVVAHLDHNASVVRMEVFEATTNKPWGRVMNLVRVDRSPTATDVSRYSWAGTATLNKRTVMVPNGNYVLKLSVLRALGNADNPAHWETWTSPVITINRP